MKIAETYSHLNGLEFLLVHKSDLWENIQSVIAEVDALLLMTFSSSISHSMSEIELT